ncbi:MAG: GNAT family N-acetyltransferase [Anaerolineaceae bacterium]
MTSPQLAFPVAGRRVRLVEGAPGSVSVIRLADETAVGTFALEVDDRTLTIRWLCIDAPQRGYGAGSEAAQLLAASAEAAGFSAIRAWAHPQLGLSAYFWGRMGLRPLHGEGPEGGIWYERAVSFDAIHSR